MAEAGWDSLYSPQDKTVSHLASLYLVRERQPIDLQKLCNSLKSSGIKLSYDTIHSILRKFPNNFKIHEDDVLRVQLITKISMCETHWKKNHSCSGNLPLCSGLHICKFFILSGTCKFGQKCTFGHDLTTAHNMMVLKEHMLDGASVGDLKFLLSAEESRPDCTAPRICKFYNNKQGCKMSKTGKICSNLHICRHYIQHTCTFGKKCLRSHDILEAGTKAVLEKHGISTRRTPAEILAHLRQVLTGDDDDDSSTSSVPSVTSDLNRVRIAAEPPKKPPGPKTPKGPVRTVSVQGDEGVSICFYYLRGSCLYGEGCRNFHSKLLYQWRYRQCNETDWELVSPKENRDMELSYSDPENREYFFNPKTGTTCKIQFKTTVNMPGVDDAGTPYEIQRISTVSSVLFERQTLTTEWIWYWKDQKGVWKKYGEADRGYKADLGSYELEQAYLRNPEGQMSFNTLGHEYILDFPKMVQRNLKYKTEREVSRRPKFVDPWELEKSQPGNKTSGLEAKGEHSVSEKAPPHWSRVDDLWTHCKLIELQERIPSTKKEYKEIENLFCGSMPSTTSILSIERIENGELYCDYISKKQRMEKKKKDCGERRLFHGTKTCYVDAICKQGFDFRLNGQSVGTLYGKGSYFAKTSKYSHSYTDNKGICSMFIVKVLVGEYALGNRTYVRPPPKDEKNLCSDLYDSCVNNVSDPTIFVIFDNSGQVYPEYLIKYEYKF